MRPLTQPTNQKKDYSSYHSHTNREALQQTPKNPTEYVTFPVGEYFKIVYTLLSQKNLKEMDEFLDSSEPPELNQEEINS